jgi:hypothetical protein
MGSCLRLVTGFDAVFSLGSEGRSTVGIRGFGVVTAAWRSTVVGGLYSFLVLKKRNLKIWLLR